jgi:dihydrofolate reductase
MRKLLAFTSVSIDGYFADVDGDMSWAHGRPDDEEWNAFVAGNASGGGQLLFGRVTYEMMASYWPTPMADEQNPVVAKHMNGLSKVVFSKTLEEASWSNTKLVKGDLTTEVRRMKEEPGEGMAILGSGSIVSQLAEAGLIDEFQIVVVPIILGDGKKLFDVGDRLNMKLRSARSFKNGNVVLSYEPGA